MVEQPDEQQRRGWRLLWLSCIQAFADAEVQRERWLDPAEGNPYYSFIECMCRYFDDALNGSDEPYRERLNLGFVSEAEASAVADFHALADAYESPGGDDYDDPAILADPSWLRAVEAAQTAQQRLLPLLKAAEERAVLTRPLQWSLVGKVYSPQWPRA